MGTRKAERCVPVPLELGSGRLWVDFVGKNTYSEELFLHEALEMGFNRRTGNHVPPLGSYILFARWDSRKGTAYAFAVGVVDGYSFIIDNNKLSKFLSELLDALEQCKESQEDCRELKELKENLDNLLREAAKARGGGGGKVTRGCGEYTEVIIDFDLEKFYDGIIKLAQKFFGKIPFAGVFADGHIVAYGSVAASCPVPLRFTRGVVPLKASEEKEVRRVLNRCAKLWVVADSEKFAKLALLEDYRQVKHRTSAERNALLASLRASEQKEGGKA
jgi:hypothetical protein